MIGSTQIKGKQGRFGAIAGVQQTFSVALCLPGRADGESIVLTGTEQGSVYVWDRLGKLLHIRESVHDKGVLSLALVSDLRVFVSGGGDGYIRVWKLNGGLDYFDTVSSFDVKASFAKVFGGNIGGNYVGQKEIDFGICAIAVNEVFGASRDIAVGTGHNSVCVLNMREDGSIDVSRSRSVVEAHFGGDVLDICAQPGSSASVGPGSTGHPGSGLAGLVATAGSDACVRIWNVAKRQLVQCLHVKVPYAVLV
jgi:WD40 repeat protein